MSMASKILSGICVLILLFVLLPMNIFGQESPASLEEVRVERGPEPIEGPACET